MNSFYQKLIAEALPGRSDVEYREVETIMRADVFHSTLDWQTRAQLITGARKAAKLFTAHKKEGIL